MKSKLIEAIGWYGTCAIIGAYALTSFNFITPQSVIYQLLNITGAIGIVLISIRKKVYQPVVLNIIWTFIGGIALIRLLT